MELVEEGEAVVHVLERQVVRTDAGALVQDPPHSVGGSLPLVERGLHALQLRPGLTVAHDVGGFRLMVLRALGGREDDRERRLDGQIVVVDVGRLGDPPRAQVVLDGDHLRPVLAVEPIRVHQAVLALHFDFGQWARRVDVDDFDRNIFMRVIGRFGDEHLVRPGEHAHRNAAFGEHGPHARARHPGL